MAGIHELIEMTEGKVGEGWTAGHGPAVGSHTGSIGGSGATAKLAGGSSDEDVVGGRVEHPVVAFARVVVVTRHFDKALVEAEVVTDRVLPSLFVVPIVRKVGHDVFIDAIEC